MRRTPAGLLVALTWPLGRLPDANQCRRQVRAERGNSRAQLFADRQQLSKVVKGQDGILTLNLKLELALVRRRAHGLVPDLTPVARLVVVHGGRPAEGAGSGAIEVGLLDAQALAGHQRLLVPEPAHFGLRVSALRDAAQLVLDALARRLLARGQNERRLRRDWMARLRLGLVRRDGTRLGWVRICCFRVERCKVVLFLSLPAVVRQQTGAREQHISAIVACASNLTNPVLEHANSPPLCLHRLG